MKRLVRRLFGPSNSLLLLYDHFDDGVDELRAQVDEVRRYYELGTLSQIVGHDGKNAVGRAAVLFRNARKSVLLKALPWLLGEEVPWTLFLRSDCIGLNRLPPEEELRAYREAYPDKTGGGSWRDAETLEWRDPSAVENLLLRARAEIGPLPVQSLDPTAFFATWGKVLETPPQFRELGLHVQTSPLNAELKEAATFVRQQTRGHVKVAFSPRSISAEEGERLRALGFEALVTPRPGMVEKDTPALDLPCWPFERED